MRLAIDMQGAQSSVNRNRGIGRYTNSLVRAMVQQRGDNEVYLILNGTFSDTIEPILADFAEILPIKNIRVWGVPTPCNAVDSGNDARRCAAELIREAFIFDLKPDVLLLTSLFEGAGDDAVGSVGAFASTLPTAVVLYDLIPLIHRTIYLSNPAIERWYLNKIDHLRRADLLLSISASSMREGVDCLGFHPHQVVNISTACDDHFRPEQVSADQLAALGSRYGLVQPFVMYTGGIDHRKNIEGLIRAYAALPSSIRQEHQLAVVCSVNAPDRTRLEQLACCAGLADGELIMTGFVPEDDLVALYNSCKLFVFPSWHEGFGLPALEAMACGRAVIGANTSSVPEVIGRADALFDPRSDESITHKMLQVLTDNGFRSELEAYGSAQAAQFTWKKSAATAWLALQTIARPATPLPMLVPVRRPRLAYVSPVPVAKSGIADYSAELLPELSRYYQIDVVVCQDEAVDDAWIKTNCPMRSVEWFLAHAADFDRVIYHFGNSHFHSHMFGLLAEIPGVVVLHDFFLSGISSHRDIHEQNFGGWSKDLLAAHGWPAVISRYTASDTVWVYPCNIQVLQDALGVIVHSENSRKLANTWYGQDASKNWALIPLMRVAAAKPDRQAARTAMGINVKDFVVCSFGMIGSMKLNQRLLQAWLASPLATDPHCRLIFVGQNEGGEYGAEILRVIRDSVARVEITGWVDTPDYRQWLAAADVAVQLRTLSRGETSAAVLDCMNYGIATIVNAHGAMQDLPEDAVYRLPDEFSDDEMIKALTDLWQKDVQRNSYSEQGRKLIQTEHLPRRCADMYAIAIEDFYQRASTSAQGLAMALAHNLGEKKGLVKTELARCLAANFSPKPRRSQLLIDISAIINHGSRDATTIDQERQALSLILSTPVVGWQIEAVRWDEGTGSCLRYARQYVCNLLCIPSDWSHDDEVETWPGDVLISWGSVEFSESHRLAISKQRQRGIAVYLFVPDFELQRLQATRHQQQLSTSLAFQAYSSLFQGLLFSDEVNEVQFDQMINTLVANARSLFPKMPFVSTIGGYDHWVTNCISAIEKMRCGAIWKPNPITCYLGSDIRLSSQVGERQGNLISSTGKSGFLFYGPYSHMLPGKYQCNFLGEAHRFTGNEYFDMSSNHGDNRIAHCDVNIGSVGQFERSIDFHLNKSLSDFEIRFWVAEDSHIEIHSIYLSLVLD